MLSVSSLQTIRSFFIVPKTRNFDFSLFAASRVIQELVKFNLVEREGYLVRIKSIDNIVSVDPQT